MRLLLGQAWLPLLQRLFELVDWSQFLLAVEDPFFIVEEGARRREGTVV